MPKRYLNCYVLKIFLASFLVFACKGTSVYQVTSDIIITLKSDQHIKIEEPETISVKKGDSWENVKSYVKKKIQIEDYFTIAYWRLENEKGQILRDSYKFSKDETIFAVSKPILYVAYTVKHYKQNINDNDYTLDLNEIKSGVAGADTEALAKIYEGFNSKPFSQIKIEDDGSTVVRIDYDRKITSIMLDLAGGKTTTILESGKGGKSVLRGRFGSKIKLEPPIKSGCFFKEWLPSLPEAFPSKDEEKVYTAKYSDSDGIIFINGDERIDITGWVELSVSLDNPKTWATIKTQAIEKVPLKTEWLGGDYGIYEWREDDENGKLIEDSTPITKGMKVFAVSNYMNFGIQGNELNSYEGEKPRGRVIIPKEITRIGKKVFYECVELTNVNFSRCTNITTIDEGAFLLAKALKDIDLSNKIGLTSIGKSAFESCFGLVNVNLSGCTNLSSIGESSFRNCNTLKDVNLSACTKLMTINKSAFENCFYLHKINLADCTKLKSIDDSAFSMCRLLGTLDLSKHTNLTSIGKETFICKNATVKLPTSINSIGDGCFGPDAQTYYHYCWRVIVPNKGIKEKVLDSGFLEGRIIVEN